MSKPLQNHDAIDKIAMTRPDFFFFENSKAKKKSKD